MAAARDPHESPSARFTRAAWSAAGYPEVVLGSTSRYRRLLFDQLGLPYVCVSPDVDERALERPEWPPARTAIELARAKAEAVALLRPNSIVIGGDQVAACEGEVLHKPGDVQTARGQLRRLSGRSHQLLTAVCVIPPAPLRTQGPLEHLDTTTLTMRDLSDEEIARYVDADLPLDCAGSYRLERLGVSLFRRIESADQTSIVGLPLIALCDLLRKCGLPLP